MAISKFDKFVNKDWSWTTPITKLPELDFAGFNEVLNQQQSQIDQVGLLSSKRPNVLNNQADLELYQGYQKDVDTALDTVSKEYGKGITAGNMAYKNYLNQFRKDWSPGGRADILNKRNEAYNSGIAAIDKFYADDTSPVNKTLAKRQLQEQLNKPINVDPSTGQFTNFSQPELYKNPDVNKAIDEMLKEIKENGDTTFLGDTNKSWWIQKIKSETREPERIKLAYQALSQQPEYSSQINRDAQYKALTVDPVKYQEQFTNQQTGALKSLESISEKAKTDPQSATELQTLLRQEGYNVQVDGKYGPLTEKATKEYLDKKKSDVQSNISGFDLNQQLRNDVNKSYLGYALRGAYEKKDVDLIFNQAKKAMLDDSRKREENQINRDRLTYEFAGKDQSQILAVDSIAQQLPEIQKHYQDLKTQRDSTEKTLNKTLSNSRAFKGWNMDNVAQAYQKWQDVTGATEAEKKANYKAALNQGGSFQFTDDQVDLLYQEMNAPVGEGALKTTLEAFNNVQNEVNRFEEGQQAIASQYIETPEGQARLNVLKRGNIRPEESDVDIIKRATSDPNSFEYDDGTGRKFNPAVNFMSHMSDDIKAQQKQGKNYDWGVLGTTEIHAGTKDTTLKPAYDMIAGAIETGTGDNFTTFGVAGLTFKGNDGVVIEDAEAKKVGKMAVTKDLAGNPILKIGVTITKPDGKTKDGFTEVAIVPGSAISYELQSGLTNAYISKFNAGEKVAAQGVLDNLDAIRGKNGINDASIDIQVKNMNLNNTQDEGLMTINPQTKEVVPIKSLGWQSKNLSNRANIGGMSYETYGINTPSGNYVADVVIDPTTGAKVIVPSLVGQPLYSSAAGVSKNRLGKQILSQAQVEVTKQKQ